MRCVVISDTHGMYRKVDVPDGDVLIHCGDIFRAAYPRPDEYRDFVEWLDCQPHKYKICIAGNHEKGLERASAYFDVLMGKRTNYHYLENSGIEIAREPSSRRIEGVKFWGSPYTPEFFDWAFMKKRGAEIKEVWDQIPEDTDVLITHGPPFGVLDRCPFPVGCEELLLAVERINPQYHCFGHIHEGYGTDGVMQLGDWALDTTEFINASICTGDYRPINKPIVFDI